MMIFNTKEHIPHIKLSFVFVTVGAPANCVLADDMEGTMQPRALGFRSKTLSNLWRSKEQEYDYFTFGLMRYL